VPLTLTLHAERRPAIAQSRRGRGSGAPCGGKARCQAACIQRLARVGAMASGSPTAGDAGGQAAGSAPHASAADEAVVAVGESVTTAEGDGPPPPNSCPSQLRYHGGSTSSKTAFCGVPRLWQPPLAFSCWQVCLTGPSLADAELGRNACQETARLPAVMAEARDAVSTEATATIDNLRAQACIFPVCRTTTSILKLPTQQHGLLSDSVVRYS
jgi:hypothetical protein